MFDANVKTGEIRFYGSVGRYFDDGVGVEDMIGALDSMDGRDITLTIKSDGGDVFEGLSIYNQLSRYPGKVTIMVDAIAASIASVIAMAGDDVAIHEGSMLMIHNPWTVAVGDAREFRGVADLLDTIAGEIAGIYVAKSKGKAEEFLTMMESDTYITAADALDLGLVDRVIAPRGKSPKAAAQNAAPVSSAAGFPLRLAAKQRLRSTRVKI